MSESANKPDDHNSAVSPSRQRFRLRLWIGMLLLNLGTVFTTMKTVQHLKQQPPEPLVFDFTLRWGDGGFIVYGVVVAVLGFILVCMEPRHRKGN